jgi:MFS family permease
VLLCLLNFLNFAGMWMLPAMLPVHILRLGAESWMLGWIMGLTAIATIITRPLAGFAVDRFGRRGVFTVGTIGMIVTCLGFAVMPVLGAVLAIRFIQGLAWGFTNTACTTIAADAIPKPRYGEGMGYFTLASSLAMIISPALSLGVFYALGGGVSALICAAFFCLSLACSCFVSYRRVATRPLRATKTAGEKRTVQTQTRAALRFIRHTLLERSALGAGVCMMLTASSYGLVQTFLPAMLDAGRQEFVGPFFIVMAVVALIARPLFGRWADTRNYFEPAAAAFICMAVSLMLLALPAHVASLMGAAVLQGIGYSAGFSLFMALATLHIDKPSRRGAAIATVMVGFDIGSGITAVGLGALSASLGFEFIFGLGALVALAGLALVLLRRRSLF